MMGIKERLFHPLPGGISLEDLVPRDNFHRRLEAMLDLSLVRDPVRPLYARGGRPSVDPVVFFRLQLVLFFEGLRSERELMRVAADRLSVRWYLGHDLHEPLPDHSNLTRTRERFGPPVSRRFFERIVEECVEAGLVRGDELFFDSTKVAGDAAIDSLAPRWAVEARLDGLFEEEPAEEEPAEEEPAEEEPAGHGPPVEEAYALPSAGDAALRERNAARRGWIPRDGAQDRTFKVSWRERASDRRAGATDPDATPMTWAASGRKLGYRAHYVVDGGKARIVVNALATSSGVTENRPMLDLLWRTRFRWSLRPHHVTADGEYGTLENIAALEQAGIRAYVALHESGSKPNRFPKVEFRHDSEEDVHTRPAGGLLRPLGKKEGVDRDGKATFCRARASECAACQLKPQRTSNKNGRQIRRDPAEHCIDLVRGYRGTAPYDKALRKRKVWIEPLFAEAKDWHGMRRFRLRALWKVNTETLLAAAGQNLKRLLVFGRRPPRNPAPATALRSPALGGGHLFSFSQHRTELSPASTGQFCNALERLGEAGDPADSGI